MIKAQIIADSVNPCDNRLTSFVLTFPRWILAELNTHRSLSKNVASSRAIKIEKMIKMVEDNPAIPSFWGKNESGMQSSEQLVGSDLDRAKEAWLRARDRAVESAKELSSCGLHKQYVNRTIENFMYVTAIVSGTDFENMFALRAHKDAQPEFQELAFKMLDEYNKSTPKSLKEDEWHIPFGDKFDDDRVLDTVERLNFDTHWAHGNNNLVTEKYKKMIAISRCARVSYVNFDGKDDYEADIKLCDRLFGSIPKHLSPTEHVAMSLNSSERIGNFCGFKQYRKFMPDENLSDNRIIKKQFLASKLD